MSNLFVSDVMHDYYVDILRELVAQGHTVRVLKTSERPGYSPPKLAALLGEIQPRVLIAEDFHFPERFEKICDPDFSVLSLEFFSAVAYYERMFLLSSDRLAFWPLSHIERSRMFYLQIAHLYKVLKTEGVDAVLFYGIPHGMMEIALFALAKALGLNVLYVDWPGFSPHFATIETEIVPRRTSAGFMPDRKDDDEAAAICRQFKSELLAPPVWKAFTAPNRLRVLLRTVAGLLLRAPFQVHHDAAVFFLNRGRRWRAGYVAPLVRHYLRTERVVKFYERHARTHLPDGAFAAFFLHVQPESSTLPQGGLFVDQLLAFDLILQALPAGMKVCVKEHPAMFTNFAEDRHARSIDFYAHMLRDDRVVLVDRSMSSNDLLARASFVLSINGTISWEAMRAGKPSINFGWAWFAPCASCFIVDSVESLRSAFAAAAAKSAREVQADVDQFLEEFARRLIPAVPNHTALNYARGNVDYAASIRTLSEALSCALMSDEQARASR